MKYYIVFFLTIISLDFCFCQKHVNDDPKIEDIYNQAKKYKAIIGNISDYNFSVKRVDENDCVVRTCSQLDLSGYQCLTELSSSSFYKILLNKHGDLVYLMSYSNVILNYEMKWFKAQNYSIGFTYLFSDINHNDDEVTIVEGFFLFDLKRGKLYFMNFMDNSAGLEYPFTNTRDIIGLDQQLYPVYKIISNNRKMIGIRKYVYKNSSQHDLNYESVNKPLKGLVLNPQSTLADLNNYDNRIRGSALIEQHKIKPDVNNLKYPMWVWAEGYEFINVD